ncbi:RNA polymerase sigma factor [Metabacillus malikii]|uniref:RNA polymerase sigma-70 factor (ECF subfamily) n=1 Tax=Metabacillus malikii TaxID=1504265 RepID=A0ABT9ZMG3_9BACI|nr:sigma-70 family RNA polymerase sigma factor [Metabacillus malikii]MDQ0233447.1 RNA polymerase sigma-70 factor (ECF subfamily) [Metabacillus malikii]
MDENQRSLILLQEISRGSRHSFNQFYEKYIGFVYQIAFHIIKDHAETEDLCHDLFLEVYQNSSQYDPSKGSVKAWLAVKAKSRSLDRLRKKKPLLHNRLQELLKEEESGADIAFLSQIEHHILKDALLSIPIQQREAIIRSYFRNETHKEISTKMNKPLGTIKSLIRYGLTNMRKQKTLLNWVDSSGGEKKNEL